MSIKDIVVKQNTIYTLGTGTRTIGEFLDIIKCKAVDVIVDVRRFPTSKFLHFKKENFAQACVSHHVAYVYLGNELGGYRKGGYEEYSKTEEFQAGIEKLKLMAEKKVICIVCAETLPWRCHRRFIGHHLSAQGYEVIHIIDEKHDWKTR
ncbi:MAG: DUF488 family protein [Candidatus Hodarchaeota archaeon]|nr:MAG: DUF488 domain-containing protein [candidate division WOR-3 bacterium]